MEYYVIVYKNTHDAMLAEKKLTENNFDFKIMPTPTSITQSCGICTRFEKENEITNIIENNIIEYKNIYKKTKEGFKTI
ncbi:MULTISPECIES: DUF3343 domain-containing protein [Clostridium]|uniref:DUF3343 domain-containing protein n=1 Tax=Clostridium cibarium TaxID=2762247 RepID=A0ABR8PY61_9CLOT|nr:MULTISPECIES: DUF3343 domain-containing protein [Clostridium]MBD7913101.1 DUF3343 domain-containing protein [Clostridium cibarium]